QVSHQNSARRPRAGGNESLRPDTRARELPLPMSQPASQKEVGSSMSKTIDHKVSVSPLLPGVSVSLNAQPYGGFQVVVFSSAGNEPSELYAGLRAVGFASRDPGPQPTGGVRQSFGRAGSALLGGWTAP